LIPLVADDGSGRRGQRARPAYARQPDVALTLPVDWCRRFSERLSAEDLDLVVSGDRRLDADLIDAAPVLASM